MIIHFEKVHLLLTYGSFRLLLLHTHTHTRAQHLIAKWMITLINPYVLILKFAQLTITFFYFNFLFQH